MKEVQPTKKDVGVKTEKKPPQYLRKGGPVKSKKTKTKREPKYM